MTQISIMALRHSAFYSLLLMTMAAKYLWHEGLEPYYLPATTANTVPANIRNSGCHLVDSVMVISFSELGVRKTTDVAYFTQINACDRFFITACEAEFFLVSAG